MPDFEAYLLWATSENERPDKAWPVRSDLPAQDTMTLSLGLSDLCCPLFPVDPAPPKRVPEERLQKVWDKYSQLPRDPTLSAVDTLLADADEILPLFSAFDLIYVVKVGSLARLARFREAETVFEKGMHMCPVRSALCETAGLIKSYQGDPVCLGWFMQACLLGYESFGPYLELAQAAITVGMVELGSRLRNAADILNHFRVTNFRHPGSPIAIASEEVDGLRVALGTFLEYAQAFLPPADILPAGDEKQREIELILMRGWPAEAGKPKPQPLRKILDRQRFV